MCKFRNSLGSFVEMQMINGHGLKQDNGIGDGGEVWGGSLWANVDKNFIEFCNSLHIREIGWFMFWYQRQRGSG